MTKPSVPNSALPDRALPDRALPDRAGRVLAAVGLAGLLLFAAACGKPAGDGDGTSAGGQADVAASEGLAGERGGNPSTAATGPAGSAGSPAATSRPSPSNTGRPPGPYIEYFKVVQQPSCPKPEAPVYQGGLPAKLAFKIGGGADAGAVSVDNPETVGSWGTYDATKGEVVIEVPFACSSSSKSVNTHRYTLRTVGGKGTPDRKDLTLTAKTI